MVSKASSRNQSGLSFFAPSNFFDTLAPPPNSAAVPPTFPPVFGLGVEVRIAACFDCRVSDAATASDLYSFSNSARTFSRIFGSSVLDNSSWSTSANFSSSCLLVISMASIAFR